MRMITRLLRLQELIRSITNHTGLPDTHISRPLERPSIPLLHFLRIYPECVFLSHLLLLDPQHLHSVLRIPIAVKLKSTSVFRLVDIRALLMDRLAHRVNVTLGHLLLHMRVLVEWDSVCGG